MDPRKPLSRWSRRRQAQETDLDKELRADIELETEEQTEFGVNAEEARFRAMRSLGNPTLVKEDVRKTWRWARVEQFWQDLRYGVRGLRRNKGFTAVAALSLALGIGVNAAVFSLVNAVLLRQLPYSEPTRLTEVTGYYPQGAIVAMQQQSRTMDIAAYSTDSEVNLTGQGEAVRLTGSAVSANLFSVLGVEAEIGRVTRAGEDRPGIDRIVVLSDALWRHKFAANPGIVGRMITVDGVDRQVVGVMPASFEFPSSGTQLWTPLHIDPSNPFDSWNTGFIPLIARLHPDATLAQAQGELRALIAHAITLFPYPMARAWNADATVAPLEQYLVSNVRGKLIVLQCAVGLILLIACANVASLLLARAATRQKEMALRSALGADRGRIARQLLTESIVLGLVGAIAGLALAYGVLSIFKHALPSDTPGLAGVDFDSRVVLFTSLLAVATGLAFGLIPALGASRLDLAGTLRSTGRRATSTPGGRFRSALIAGEVALAVVLAVSAGLLVKSLWALAHVNPGFSAKQLLAVRVSPNQSLCQERSRCIALYDELLRRAQSITGVSAVSASNALPLSGEVPAIPVELDGHPDVPGQTLAPMLWDGAITPEFFHMMGIPLLEGRAFTPADGENSELVVVVSAATAKRFWPGEDPIGKHLRPTWGQEPWRTVVGVVGDVRQYRIASELPDWLSGVVYMPYPQAIGIDRQMPSSMTLLVRTSRDRQYVASEVRAIVAELNPNVPVGDVQAMDGVVAASESPERSIMWLFVSFAASALLLAAIGTYGVVSFMTAQRMYEMGVRIALGATRRDLFGLVLKLSLQLVLIGLGVGVALAFALTRTLASFLYGVNARDPLTFLAVALLLVVMGIAAGFIPARRAALVDPMTALRAE
jgi:putative ABC transport system permease protein